MNRPLPAYVDTLMNSLAAGLSRILGQRLVGVYLGGSLSLGDYCEAASDLDFLVVTRGPLSPEDLLALETLHRELLATQPAARRLEGDYAPQECIVPEGTTIPVPGCRRGVFLPDEDEIMLSADNVYNLRENGITFAGPPPTQVLPPVSPDQVRAAVREMLAGGSECPDRPEEQADDLLGLFRSLCALETGRPTTKSQGAEWVRSRVDPQWLPVIDAALEVRRTGSAAGWTEDIRRSAAALDRLLRQRYGMVP